MLFLPIKMCSQRFDHYTTALYKLQLVKLLKKYKQIFRNCLVYFYI